MVDQVELVERVARAMALDEWPSENESDPITWPEDFSERERAKYRSCARAAIAEVARTPTTPERSDDE